MQQHVCFKISANLRKSAVDTLEMIKQMFGEESMSHTQVFEWKNPNSLRPNRTDCCITMTGSFHPGNF
jgi:hypothetical protein